MAMSLTERREKILEMLAEDSGVSVSELSKHLGVTVVTARSDLSALEDAGLLVRTRGGAMPAFHPKIFARTHENRKIKEQIARSAASEIKDGDSVIISTGTTTAMIARYLLGKRDVHIVTNNTLLLTYARINPQLHVTLIGGEFRSAEEGVVGPMAMDALDHFYVSKAFIGIDGASEKQGFTAHFLDSSELVRKMADQADAVIAVSDSGKFGKPGFARILPFSRVDTLITDDQIDSRFEAVLSESGVRVVKAK